MGPITKRAENYVKHLYLSINSPVSFTSAHKIFIYIKKHGKFKLSLKNIQTILQQLPIYSSYRKRNNKGKKLPVICPRKLYMFMSDTFYMLKWKDHNPFSFVLINVCCMTRKIEAYPLKDLSGKSTSEALDKYLKKYKYSYMYSDLGSEFKSKETQNVLNRHGCHHILSTSGTKAFLAEAGVREIKSRLVKWMIENKTEQWCKILNQVVSNYNNCPNKRLNNLSPNQAQKLSNFKLWNILYEKEKIPRKMQRKLKKKPNFVEKYRGFSVGDQVRISKIKGLFQKYSPNFSQELFEICSKQIKSGIPIFRLRDSNMSILTGIFYSNELSKVKDAEKNYKIEKIIKEKSMFGTLYYLVKWKGLEDPTFIQATQVSRYE